MYWRFDKRKMKKKLGKKKSIPPLDKKVVNEFMVKNRKLVKDTSDIVKQQLERRVKKLSKKETENDEEKRKNKRKVKRLKEELEALKGLYPDDQIMMKYLTLNKKPLTAVLKPKAKAKPEERVLCRIGEYKDVKAVVDKFREQYPNWENEVPDVMKRLGSGHRCRKLGKLKTKNRLEQYLEEEEKCFKLLEEITGINLRPDEKKRVTAATKSKKISDAGNMNDETVGGDDANNKTVGDDGANDKTVGFDDDNDDTEGGDDANNETVCDNENVNGKAERRRGGKKLKGESGGRAGQKLGSKQLSSQSDSVNSNGIGDGSETSVKGADLQESLTESGRSSKNSHKGKGKRSLVDGNVSDLKPQSKKKKKKKKVDENHGLEPPKKTKKMVENHDLKLQSKKKKKKRKMVMLQIHQ